jgi:hypothetical protein
LCACKKPTINGQPGYCWQPSDPETVHPTNAPQIQKDDTLLFDEPGRCGRGIDSHAFHVRLILRGRRSYLCVKHFNGQEELDLGGQIEAQDLLVMSSDARYWLLMSFYRAAAKIARNATQAERTFWRKAIAENRVKKRKVRNSNQVDVWVLDAVYNTKLAQSIG